MRTDSADFLRVLRKDDFPIYSRFQVGPLPGARIEQDDEMVLNST